MQRGEFGITPNVQLTNPNLWHRALATNLHNFVTQLAIAIDSDIFKVDVQLL